MAKGIKTGGRKKGTPNKINAALKEMILGALDKAGGQKWLEKQADENPTAFLTLLGKVLPTTLAGDNANPIQHKYEVLAELMAAIGSDTGIGPARSRRIVEID